MVLRLRLGLQVAILRLTCRIVLLAVPKLLSGFEFSVRVFSIPRLWMSNFHYGRSVPVTPGLCDDIRRQASRFMPVSVPDDSAVAAVWLRRRSLVV